MVGGTFLDELATLGIAVEIITLAVQDRPQKSKRNRRREEKEGYV
jgi:hypothetical protein